MTRSSGGGPYQIGVLDRIDGILMAVAHNPATPSELANTLDLEVKTAYRIIRSLESKGYLRRLSDRRYAIGYKALSLSQSVVDSVEILAASPAVLRKLGIATQETAFLVIRENYEAICIDVATSPQPLRLAVGFGLRRGLTTGAASKALLSHAPSDVVEALLSEDLPAITENSIVDPVELRLELKGIRECGYAISDSEYTMGAGSVAAPVVSSQGIVYAAVAIGGPASRVLREGRQANIETVVAAARGLQQMLSAEHSE